MKQTTVFVLKGTIDDVVKQLRSMTEADFEEMKQKALRRKGA